MNILMFAMNDPAGTAIQFCKAINRYTVHTARLITAETRYAHAWEKDLHVPDLGPDGFEEMHILMQEADIFHFHMTCDEQDSFGPFCIADYMQGKVIVHHHHGHHDFRSNPDSFRQKYLKLGRTQLLVSTPDLLHLLPEATWQPNLIPINAPQFTPQWGRYDDKSLLKVCHSPTRKELKNTDTFLAVIRNLQSRAIHLDVDLIDNVPNLECLSRKRRCHVLFDHMQGYYGVSSLEGLSQGLVVLAGLDEWVRQCIGELTGTDALPWLLVRDDVELEKSLCTLEQDRAYCQHLGDNSRVFMEKYWSDKCMVDRLVSFYESP